MYSLVRLSVDHEILCPFQPLFLLAKFQNALGINHGLSYCPTEVFFSINKSTTIVTTNLNHSLLPPTCRLFILISLYFLHQVPDNAAGWKTLWNILSYGSRRRFIAPRSTLKYSDFMWAISFSSVSHSSRRMNWSSLSKLWQKSQRLHPFSIFMIPDSEVIACNNSIRFSGKTFIRVITRIMQSILACSLPKKELTHEHLFIP